MSTFIVALFSDTRSAGAGTKALKDLATDRVIRLHGSATVTKGDDGKLSMQVTADEGHRVTAAGVLIGGAAGLAIGPLAAAILAAGGAVFGASAALTNRASGKVFAEQVTQDLALGSVAVVAEVSTEDLTALISRLEAAGGTVTRQDSLSKE